MTCCCSLHCSFVLVQPGSHVGSIGETLSFNCLVLLAMRADGSCARCRLLASCFLFLLCVSVSLSVSAAAVAPGIQFPIAPLVVAIACDFPFLLCCSCKTPGVYCPDPVQCLPPPSLYLVPCRQRRCSGSGCSGSCCWRRCSYWLQRACSTVLHEPCPTKGRSRPFLQFASCSHWRWSWFSNCSPWSLCARAVVVS